MRKQKNRQKYNQTIRKIYIDNNTNKYIDRKKKESLQFEAKMIIYNDLQYQYLT